MQHLSAADVLPCSLLYFIALDNVCVLNINTLVLKNFKIVGNI